jgi:DNA topoisomerase-1
VGRYGPYLERGEERASIPEDMPPDELSVDAAVALLEAPKGDRVVGDDPVTGSPVYAKAGRYGPYVQLGEMEDGAKEKPRTASLFQTMSVETVTLDEALQLLSLPRVVGAHPESGEEITALNGRYGPYLKKGTDTRSLETEEQIFTVDVADAVKLFAEPKRRRGQRAPAQLRELGPDPTTGQPMVIKDGRFGPYVTDGETNASLRKGDQVETITIERAGELLQDRRDRGPAKKRAAKRKKAAPKKKAASKKPAAKKPAAKKASAKKATAKRPASEKAAGEAPPEPA